MCAATRFGIAIRCAIVVFAVCWAPLARAQTPPTGTDELSAQQLQESIDALFVDQRWTDALTPARKLVELRAENANGKTAGLAPALNQLAGVERQAGELEAARQSYSRAIRVLEADFGTIDSRLIAPLRGLGLTYAALDMHEYATVVLERAVQIVRRNLGLFDPQQIDLVEQITTSEMQLGALDSAEGNVRYLLRVAANVYGEDDPRVAEPLCVLAYGYSQRGEYGIARELYLRAIAWIEAKGGPRHPALIGPLRGIADAQMRAFREGDPDKARADRQRISRNPLGTRLTSLTYVDPRPGNRRNLTPEGQSALERAIALIEARPGSARTVDLVATLLQAGDWCLAKGDRPAAHERYAEVWRITHEHDLAWAPAAHDAPAIPLAAPVAVFMPPVVVHGAHRDRAAVEGTSQDVLLSFTVTAAGTVRDIRVVESNAGPHVVRSAIDAVERAIYRPRYEDGRAIATTGVAYHVTGAS